MILFGGGRNESARYLFIYLSIYLFIYLFICLFVCLFIYLFIHLCKPLFTIGKNDSQSQ